MSFKSIKSASFHDRERLLAVHSQDKLGWPTLSTILQTYMQTREMCKRQESCSLNASRSTRATPSGDHSETLDAARRAQSVGQERDDEDEEEDEDALIHLHKSV